MCAEGCNLRTKYITFMFSFRFICAVRYISRIILNPKCGSTLLPGYIKQYELTSANVASTPPEKHDASLYEVRRLQGTKNRPISAVNVFILGRRHLTQHLKDHLARVVRKARAASKYIYLPTRKAIELVIVGSRVTRL